uniref:Serine aminopeptidase S33 domain-containing protein n=1 Tax=Entomoneis paludosa TaxID=265537 RepID=A0A7S2Y9R0_9STRA|mmetsp:Transcript_23488/g.48765  ORF Transcript_23488/g.48765 Transcript_23488/m.48765 type:complete len:356 (+) Transcript_23488:206-1273(+)
MVKRTIFGVERDIDIGDDVFPSPEEFAALEAPMGEHTHGWFDSCIDGAKLHYREFIPKGGKPDAIVVFINGVTSHSGEIFVKKNGQKTSVGLLIDTFNGANIALYSHDNYGHGYSEGDRFYIPSYESNLQDYLKFIKMVGDKNKGELPVYIMGISYGGTLTLHAARKIQDDPSLGPKKFSGCILACPAIIGDLPPFPVYQILRYILAPLFPKWTPFFMPNPISPDRIWSDPEVLEMHRNPRMTEMRLAGEGEPFRLGTALSLVVSLDEARFKVIPGFNVPFYLMHGTEDHGVKIEGSEYMWSTVDTPIDSREFVHVEGGFHDLFSLPESYDLMEGVVKWMKKSNYGTSTDNTVMT